MTNFFDKLNLRPFERRLVIGLAIIVFVVIQIWFVRPHFGSWGRMDNRRKVAQETLSKFNAELAQKDKFQAEVAKLEKEGLSVPPEEQASDLMRTVDQQARQSGVQVQTSSRQTTATNQFFLERSQQVTTLSTEEGLVTFLHSLGSGNSLIRVRDLSLRPDTTRMRLNASIKLVASYQKTTAARKPAATPTNAAPAKVESRPVAPKPSTPTKK
jgi:Tfp pilus assembly protein PilO